MHRRGVSATFGGSVVGGIVPGGGGGGGGKRASGGGGSEGGGREEEGYQVEDLLIEVQSLSSQLVAVEDERNALKDSAEDADTAQHRLQCALEEANGIIEALRDKNDDLKISLEEAAEEYDADLSGSSSAGGMTPRLSSSLISSSLGSLGSLGGADALMGSPLFDDLFGSSPHGSLHGSLHGSPRLAKVEEEEDAEDAEGGDGRIRGAGRKMLNNATPPMRVPPASRMSLADELASSPDVQATLLKDRSTVLREAAARASKQTEAEVSRVREEAAAKHDGMLADMKGQIIEQERSHAETYRERRASWQVRCQTFLNNSVCVLYACCALVGAHVRESVGRP